MRLTRRDAIAVVGTSGILTAAATVIGDASTAGKQRHNPDGAANTGSLQDEAFSTMHALAEVLYPSEVEVNRGFIKTYVERHPSEWQAEIGTSLEDLDSHSRRWADKRFAALTPERREGLLREYGIDRVQPVRDGTTNQQIRFYLVNGLLFALYTTPKGSELVGIRNPQGYPGGYQSISNPATIE